MLLSSLLLAGCVYTCAQDPFIAKWRYELFCSGSSPYSPGLPLTFLAQLSKLLHVAFSHSLAPTLCLLMSLALCIELQPCCGFCPHAMFAAGRWFSFLRPSLSWVPPQYIPPAATVNRVWCSFCWACHKEKSKSQTKNVHFYLLPRGKQGISITQNWAFHPGKLFTPSLKKEGKDGCR